ncbi:MAG: pyruvate formate-lyase-activating protein [Bulleidia sp.]
MIKANVHSIETFGSVDGPSVRYILFLKGCRLRCRFCHNPDTWDCDSADQRSAEEIITHALRYRPYWGKDGGITVSGGEPLLQIDFLIELFSLAKKNRIHTCIDTAGEPFTYEKEWFTGFEQLMALTDLLLVDIKHINREKHIRLTGKPNDNIQELFRYLDQIHKPVWIRQVLVPGWTDDPEDLKQTKAFIDTLSNVEKVEILPYHTLGISKWEKLGLNYTLKNVNPPSQEAVRAAQDILIG